VRRCGAWRARRVTVCIPQICRAAVSWDTDACQGTKCGGSAQANYEHDKKKMQLVTSGLANVFAKNDGWCRPKKYECKLSRGFKT
jgi:hypothetical protein